MKNTSRTSSGVKFSNQKTIPNANSIFTLSSLAASIAAALYPASAVLAQDAEEDTFVIEEVLVTATKRTVNLQDVPQSIMAFGTAEIEKMSFKGMDDYLKALPSASLTSAQPGRNSLVMRGVSTGNYEYRTESQVAVYLDEQPITSISQQPEVRMVDIERIEALPGPQGTLFGSSSQSGTLRIITNKPNMDEFSGQFDGSLGTTKGGDPSWDINGHVNIPLSDTFAIRAVAFAAHDGGYVDNVYGETFAPPEHGGAADNSAIAKNNQNTYEIYGGRLAAKWQMSEKWDGLFSLIGQDSKARGTWETDPFLGDFKITRFFKEWRDDTWWQASATFRGDLGFAEFTSTTSYFERDSAYAWDNMAYNQWQTSYYGPYWLPYDFDYEYGNIFNDQIQTRFAQEFRLVSQSESKLQWMAGAFYDDVYDEWEYGAIIPNLTKTTGWDAINEYACFYASYYDAAPCPIPATDITYWNNYKRTLKQTAVFGEVSYDLTDKLKMTVGGRWFQYDKTEFQQYYAPFLAPPPGSYGSGEGRTEAKGKESDTIGKFNIQYAIDDDRMVYFTMSEGFRLGGRNSPRVVGSNPNIPATYRPDTLTNYEIGIKSQWMDNRVTLNASLFRMIWDDIQINSRLGEKWWQRGTWNGKTGQVSGLEVNGSWHVTENFVLEGSAYFADAKYTADTFRPCLDEEDCSPTLWIEDGQKMPGSPDKKFWGAAEYTIPHAFGISGNMWLRYDTSYQSSTWDDLDSASTKDSLGYIPSWTSSNFQVGVGLQNDWNVTLFVRNIWDEKGISDLWSTSYLTNWFGKTGQDQLRTIQKPRTITLSVSKRF